jgi:hypothetical protein
MPNGKPDGERPDLELEVGVGVPVELKQLVAASETFQSLINEVAREHSGSAKAVKWLVEVQPGSVRLPLRAEAGTLEAAASAVREIPRSIADGLAILEREPKRPDFFSDKALEEAKKLADLGRDDFGLAVQNGGERIALSQRLSVNVSKLLGSPRTSFGTVEGKLESLSVHGSKEFSVWRVDGTRVPCHFGRYLSLDEVLPAIGKRVAARGQIKTNARTGEPQTVEVHELRVIGERTVSAAEVRGIFKGRETADD